SSELIRTIVNYRHGNVPTNYSINYWLACHWFNMQKQRSKRDVKYKSHEGFTQNKMRKKN
ncbi:hypothetical protein RUM43_014637, partial [Polyplax serrata]